MTSPARRAARAGSSAAEARRASWPSTTATARPGLALGELLADAQDRPQPGARRARRSLRPISSSVSPASRRRSRVADDHPRREAGQHRRARSRRCRRPASSWWTFWAPTATSGSASASASRDGGEAHERRADHADDAGDAGPRRRSSRASSPASAGRRVHLPVAPRTITSAHRRGSCQSRGRVDGAARRPAASSSWSGQALDPLERALDRRAVEVAAARRARASVASGVSRRASATDRTTYGLVGQPTVRLERRRSPRAGGRRPPTARWRFADSALSTRLRSPRSARDTWRASSSSSAAARADPAQERADRLAALPGHDAAAAPDPPRRRQPDVREPRGEDRRPRSAPTTNSRWVRPPRQAERAAGEEPAAQPGDPAMVGRRRPSRSGRGGRRVAGASRRGRSLPGEPEQQPSERASRRADVGQRDGLRAAVAGARRVDRRELGPQREHEVAVGAGHVGRAASWLGPARRRGIGLGRARRPPAGRAFALAGSA